MNKNFPLHAKSVKPGMILIIIGFLLGCHIDSEKASVERIKIDKLTNSVNLSEIADSIHLVFLDGSVEPISIISHIQFVNDFFYISDKREKLNCYHSDGSLFFSINKIGKGPGEYLTVSRFVVEKKTKSIYI